MGRYSVVFCTVPSRETGISIGEELVKKQMAACVNIVDGIMSIFSWKGEVCRENELLLIIKGPSKNFETIRKEIASLHPYEVPEIIELEIQNGHQDYLRWIDEVTH